MPFILWAAGLLFIFLEFYLPGGIMAAIGACLLFASIIIFILSDYSFFLVGMYILGVAATVAFIVRYALWRIPRAPKDYSIYLDATQEGFAASAFDKTAIGKTGVALTDLRPGGYVKIDKKKIGAISQSGYITQGDEVVVIGGEGESLIVKLKK